MLSFLDIPVNPEALDLTAGETLAGGTELLCVPSVAIRGKAVVVRALIHNHGLSKDGLAAEERRPFGVLELPPHMAPCVAIERPEITDVVVEPRGTVVPAVRLTWRLQVFACTTAVSVVPFSLVDGVAVALVAVGHLCHRSPEKDGRAWSKLNELDLAVRIASRVGRVGLHPAVAARHSALVWVLHAPIPPLVEELVVVCDGLPCGFGRRYPAIRVIATRVGPLVGELRHVRLDRLFFSRGLFDDSDVSVVALADRDAS